MPAQMRPMVLLGIMLFDYAARKSGFYAAKTPKLNVAIS